MKNDNRYRMVKSVWVAGDLNDFMYIFEIVPKSVVSADLGVNYERFSSKLKNPDRLTFKEILLLAELTGVEVGYIAGLIIALIEKDSGKNTFKVHSQDARAARESLAS